MLLFTAISLHAQSAPAPSNLEILITDASGARITGAKVTVGSGLSDTTAHAQTDREGIAQLAVQPGSHEVSAEAVGFKKLVMKDVLVSGNARTRMTLTLQIGNMDYGSPCCFTEPLPLIAASALTITIAEIPLTKELPLKPVKFRRTLLRTTQPK